jgi:hypothetical protein
LKTGEVQEAPDHIKETWHYTIWILEVIGRVTRDGMPFKATHLFITSLGRTPESILQLVRGRWCMESWHWIFNTQLHEDKHRFRGDGAGVMATLPTAALNLLLLS